MNRLLLLCLALVALAGSSTVATGDENRPPNVVFILADDLGWGEVGAFGQEKIRTPNLDRLASEGMRLTQHYAGAPVCAPSRAVLLTGKHLGHAEIRGNRDARTLDREPRWKEGQAPLSDEALTMAEVLQAHGYATGIFGKWGLGPSGSTGDPNRQGFDRFYGYICQRVAHSYFPPHLHSDGDVVMTNDPSVPGHAQQPDGDVTMGDWQGQNYAPALILEQGLAFLDEQGDRPFFAYFPFIEPHVAMQPPPELVESYPAEWDDEPYRGDAGYTPHPRPHAGYAAMITDLDRHVGAVLDKLDALGVSDNTLVIFTSDNGTTHGSGNSRFDVGGSDAAFFNSTRDLRGFKGSVFEGGLRVPTIVRWPGHVAAGSESDFASYFPDWFPTLCAVSGVEAPAGLDGVDLGPVLRGDPPASRNAMVWAFAGYGGQYAIRDGDWKAVRQGVLRDRPGEWQLYDLSADPSEQRDVAADHPDVLKRLVGVLREQVSPNDRFAMPRP